MGWDTTILNSSIGLSQYPMIVFGLVFSDLGLKSQNLQVHPTKINFFLISDMF